MILLENTAANTRLRVLLAIAVLQFSGCAVGPKYLRSVVQLLRLIKR